MKSAMEEINEKINNKFNQIVEIGINTDNTEYDNIINNYKKMEKENEELENELIDTKNTVNNLLELSKEKTIQNRTVYNLYF